jgi:hypothetical protein
VEVAEIRRVTEVAEGILCGKSGAFELGRVLHEGYYHTVIVLSRAFGGFF